MLCVCVDKCELTYIRVWYPVWARGSLCLCAYVCVQESGLFVALSVVRIRVMRVMMCEAVVFCARATLRLTPHSHPNVFLIHSIPHHQSASSDSNRIHMKLSHKRVHMHIYTVYCIFTCSHTYAVNTDRAHTHTTPHAVTSKCMYLQPHQDMRPHTFDFSFFLFSYTMEWSLRPATSSSFFFSFSHASVEQYSTSFRGWNGKVVA